MVMHFEAVTGLKSTHTFILYLSEPSEGGETVLLELGIALHCPCHSSHRSNVLTQQAGGKSCTNCTDRPPKRLALGDSMYFIQIVLIFTAFGSFSIDFMQSKYNSIWRFINITLEYCFLEHQACLSMIGPQAL